MMTFVRFGEFTNPLEGILQSRCCLIACLRYLISMKCSRFCKSLQTENGVHFFMTEKFVWNQPLGPSAAFDNLERQAAQTQICDLGHNSLNLCIEHNPNLSNRTGKKFQPCIDNPVILSNTIWPYFSVFNIATGDEWYVASNPATFNHPYLMLSASVPYEN